METIWLCETFTLKLLLKQKSEAETRTKKWEKKKRQQYVD